MATSLSSLQVALNVLGLYQNSVDIGTVDHRIAWSPSCSFSDGTGANQANKIFADTRTLTASSTENLDLAGSLLDDFGNTLTFTKIKALLIVAAAGNANDVVVGGAASNGFATPFGDPTDKVLVKPGGMLALVAPDANGFAVTAATADILKVANSAGGTSVTYTVVIIGVG